jgi:uncharacterized membrane protein YhhN
MTAAGTGAALLAARARRPLAYGIAKALASAGFVFVAVSAAVSAHLEVPAALVAAGLAAAAVSAVALAVPGRTGLVAGMAGFALAHTLVASGFAARAGRVWLLPAAVLGAAGGIAVRRWLSGRAQGALPVAAGAYACVAIAMAVAAAGAARAAGVWQIGLGAALVVGSDLAVAAERFFGRGLAAKAIGLPAYYAGQILVAFGIASL